MFDWDSKKNASNLKKHDMSFETATEVFSDSLATEAIIIVNNEKRVQIIGKIDDTVVSVIFTERLGKKRIISARAASKKERLLYEQGTTA